MLKIHWKRHVVVLVTPHPKWLLAKTIRVSKSIYGLAVSSSTLCFAATYHLRILIPINYTRKYWIVITVSLIMCPNRAGTWFKRFLTRTRKNDIQYNRFEIIHGLLRILISQRRVSRIVHAYKLWISFLRRHRSPITIIQPIPFCRIIKIKLTKK